jgi:hypothetical protein
MLNNIQKSKLIQIKRSLVRVHSAALPAHLFLSQISYQYNDTYIPEDIQELKSLLSPPIVIKIDNNNYQSIAYWTYIKLKGQGKIPVILISGVLTNTEIELIAWHSATIQLLQSSHRNNGLSDMVELLSACPDKISELLRKKINSINNSRISAFNTIVQTISDESREVLENQLKKLNHSNQPPPLSRFDQLYGEGE